MPTPTHSYRFNLQIGRNEIRRYYQGTAREIRVLSENGQRLSFAARHLRPFITENGIHGQFLLTTDENHRFLALTKLR